jgi:hypothetical protein
LSRALLKKNFEISTWNFISLRRSAAHKNDNSILHNFSVIALCYFLCLIFVQSITKKSLRYQHELLPFVIFSHQYSHRFHFSHQFSLPKDLLKLNYSALLHIYSSNEQTHSARDGHVDMALVKFIFWKIKFKVIDLHLSKAMEHWKV